MNSGYGFGIDAGMIITLPNEYLPTFGILAKDLMGTSFTMSTILNNRTQAAPSIMQNKINMAFSIHPYFSYRFRSTIAIEYKDVFSTLPWQKKLHIGVQFRLDREKYLWAGLGQLYLSLGYGLRLPGGNLEIGTYGEDIGEGNTRTQDRRYFMRYTIGF